MQSELDSVLLTLTKAVHSSKSDGYISLTLTVSGLLISGKLISREEFFGGDLMKHVLEMTKDEPLEKYIHLKDTKFFSTSNPTESFNTGGKWRGLLSHVDGFMLGEYDYE